MKPFESSTKICVSAASRRQRVNHNYKTQMPYLINGIDVTSQKWEGDSVYFKLRYVAMNVCIFPGEEMLERSVQTLTQ